VSTSALTDAIYQNTVGNSQGFPVGVPTYYSWYGGSDTVPGNTPPSNFSSVTGWGQIYPEVGAPVDTNPNLSVQIANFQTYVHLTSGGWVLVQSEATNSIGGAHYLADFSGNSSVPWNETVLPDGSVSVDAPQSGYNDHFWPGARGSYAPGTVDGVFVEAQMKTNDPNANLIANLGADWWASTTAPFVYQNGVFVNNPGAGASDWVKLTTSYQNLYFTSLSAAQLQADPPPGLTPDPTTTTGGTTPASGTTPPSGTPTSGTPTSGTPTSGTPTSGTPTSGTPTTTSPPPVTTPPSTGSSGSGTTTPTTPVAPTVTVPDHSLYVSPGKSISLGIGVTVPHAGDSVTVNISGLPRYETITDHLDHKTFSGSSISLTAAEVNSGLTLTSHYWGHGRPTATLTVSATDSTGTPMTSAPRTITVVDPPATTTSSATTSTTSGTGKSAGHTHRPFDATHSFNHHPDFAGVATTLGESGASKSNTAPGLNVAASATTSAGAKAYGLFNQAMAGNFGNESHFAQTTSSSSGSPQQSSNFLAKPLH